MAELPRGVSRPFDRCLSLWIPHGRDPRLSGLTRFTSELVARTSHDRFEETISVERFRSYQLYLDV